MSRPSPPADRTLVGGIAQLLRDETRSGLVLVLGTLAALGWANAAYGSYRRFWHARVPGHVGILALPSTPRGLVGQIAMSIFFLVVGLELTRALRHGELSENRSALVPVAAAFGGIAGAVLAFLVVCHGGVAAHGWGVPASTDVAFSIGALALFGRRVPPAARAFVLALGITDDLGSLVLLVFGYSSHLVLDRLALALALVGALALLRWRGVVRAAPYLACGLVLMGTLVDSGVEPALAGVAVGLSYPVGPTPIDLEHRLRPVANLVVLPLFALANVGVHLGAGILAGGAAKVFWAILGARVVGKFLGLVGGARLGGRLAGATIPGAAGRSLLGPAMICGVGFTVPLLIAARAFAHAPRLFAAAQAGLLAGSALALGLGAVAILVPGSGARTDR